MAFNFRKMLAGLNIVPKSVSTVDSQGDMDVTSGDGKINYHNGTVSSPLITAQSTDDLTNKTYASAASDAASTGVVRLGNNEEISWRNAGDTTDLPLKVSASNDLQFNGNTLLTATGALVANKAVITDGGAALTSSPTSAAEIAQVQGLTSPAVGTTQVQTLSNKTLTAPTINGGTANLNDTTTFIRNTGDLTKQLKFDVSGVSTATTRTIIVPNANTTLVGTDVTQTLTNKDVRLTPVTKTVANNNQTLTVDEYVILLDASGGAFNLILPLGLSVPGKVYYFKKIDSTTNAVTIFGDTGNPDTIDGQPSTTLNTQYEALEIVAGPALDPNWSILDRKTLSEWILYTLTILGSVSNPTTGTTPVNTAYWRRVGDTMEIKYDLFQNTIGTSGSGTYIFPLPSGYTIDSSKSIISSAAGLGCVGGCQVYTNGLQYLGTVMIYSTTGFSLKFVDSSQASGVEADVNSSNVNLGGAADVRYTFYAKVPITDWKS